MTSSIQGRAEADVVLVNPPYEEPYVRGGVHYTAFPLGLGYLASVLKADGFSVRAFDCGVDFKHVSDAVESIVSLKARVFGITATSLGLRFANLLSRGIKNRSPESVVVVGGPHVTVDPSIVADLGADYGFRGEAEQGFLALCRHAVRGEALDNAPGMVTAQGGFKASPPCVIQNLDDLPFPDRIIFDERKYRFKSVVTSRGCPFECCYCGMAGTRFRQRGLDNVLEEVEALASRGHPTIDFADDIFTLDKGYVQRLCDRMKALKASWTCTTRADLVDYDILRAMHSAGCIHISFGVESGVEHIRFGLGKKIPNERFVEAFGDCRRLGIKTRAYAMLGLPGETLDDVHATIAFVNSLRPDNALYTPTIVFPGTRLMEYCLKNRRIRPDAWRAYMNGITPRPAFIPDGISPRGLERAIERAYKSFYLRPGFIADRFREARSFGDLVKAGGLAAAYAGEKLFIRSEDMSKYVR